MTSIKGLKISKQPQPQPIVENLPEPFDEDFSNNSDDDDEEELKPENLDLFKKNMVQFDLLDKQIKELKKHIDPYQKMLKELKQKKLELQELICEVMNSHEFELCDLPKKSEEDLPITIKYVKTSVLVPLTQDLVRELISKFFVEEYPSFFNNLKPLDKASFLINYIYNKENRSKKVKETLKKI